MIFSSVHCAIQLVDPEKLYDPVANNAKSMEDIREPYNYSLGFIHEFIAALYTKET